MEYKTVRSNRKTLCITFDHAGNIIVKAPYRVSDDYIENFVKRKENLILKRLQSIKIENDEYFDVKNKSKYLILGKKVLIPDNFKKYYQNYAIQYLSERTKYLSELSGLKYKSLHFKEYKSRWGCCDTYKNITLNYKLIMVDSKLIDYVILHELCHTKIMNHSKSFYNLLNKYINYKPIKSQLKRFSFITKMDYS